MGYRSFGTAVLVTILLTIALHLTFKELIESLFSLLIVAFVAGLIRDQGFGKGALSAILCIFIHGLILFIIGYRWVRVDLGGHEEVIPLPGQILQWFLMSLSGILIGGIGGLIGERVKKPSKPSKPKVRVGEELKPLYCSRCGARLRSDARFCHICGAPVWREKGQE